MYNDELPDKALVDIGYTPIDAEKYLTENAVLPVEGIWEYVDEMMTFSIEQLHDKRFSPRYKYRIVLLEAEDRSLEPGTIMGYMAETAKSDMFYIWLYSEGKDGELYSPRKCTVNLSENCEELIFEPNKVEVKWRVNFFRFLPSLFRAISLSVNGDNEKELTGFKRIFPKNTTNPSLNSEIIYL